MIYLIIGERIGFAAEIPIEFNQVVYGAENPGSHRPPPPSFPHDVGKTLTLFSVFVKPFLLKF
jgi:hypothetical protein